MASLRTLDGEDVRSSKRELHCERPLQRAQFEHAELIEWGWCYVSDDLDYLLKPNLAPADEAGCDRV